MCVTPLWAGGWRFRRPEDFCGRSPVAAWFLLWVAVLFELCWRAQWASIPAGLRARGSRRRRVTVVGVNTGAARIVCGNRELASAHRYGHPLRQRADGRVVSGSPDFLVGVTTLFASLSGGCGDRHCKPAKIHKVNQPPDLAVYGLIAAKVIAIWGFVGEHSGRPYRPAYALAVRGVGALPWLASTPLLRTASVATANWLQPAGMATHCAGEQMCVGQGHGSRSPDFSTCVPKLLARLSGGCGDRPELIRGCHRVG